MEVGNHTYKICHTADIQLACLMGKSGSTQLDDDTLFFGNISHKYLLSVNFILGSTVLPCSYIVAYDIHKALSCFKGRPCCVGSDDTVL